MLNAMVIACIMQDLSVDKLHNRLKKSGYRCMTAIVRMTAKFQLTAKPMLTTMVGVTEILRNKTEPDF
jgi:hypothetical protein